MKTLILLLLLCSPCYAGIVGFGYANQAMVIPLIPTFKSHKDALQWATLVRGDQSFINEMTTHILSLRDQSANNPKNTNILEQISYCRFALHAQMKYAWAGITDIDKAQLAVDYPTPIGAYVEAYSIPVRRR